MKKLYAVMVALTLVACANVGHAQTTSYGSPNQVSLPFTAQVNGQVTVPQNIAVPVQAARIVRVPDTHAIANLNRQLGANDAEILQLSADKNRLERELADARHTQSPPVRSDNNPSGWLLPLLFLLVGLVIGALLRGGGAVTHYYPPTPAATTTPSNPPADGGQHQYAHIPAVPGTSYRVEREEPKEHMIHRIEEIRMDETTAKGLVNIVEAIGKTPKPDQPVDAPSVTQL